MPPKLPSSSRTAAEEILLGARDLVESGKGEFSEWDLTVSSWKRSPNRFGCRGYEDLYPDHKRVMMEIMGGTKDNPLRKGWINRIRPNFYALSDLGKGEAERLLSGNQEQRDYHRSPQPIYDAVSTYFNHSVFRRHCKSSDQPKMWLGAASFLGITRNDAQHFEDRLRLVKSSTQAALDWLDEKGATGLTRGVSGGSTVISYGDLKKIQHLVATIESRFTVQIAAIRRNK